MYTSVYTHIRMWMYVHTTQTYLTLGYKSVCIYDVIDSASEVSMLAHAVVRGGYGWQTDKGLKVLS